MTATDWVCALATNSTRPSSLSASACGLLPVSAPRSRPTPIRSTSRSARVSMADTVSVLALATKRRDPSAVRAIAFGCAPTSIRVMTRPRRASTTAIALSFQQLTYTLSRRSSPATTCTSYG
jgi:hypothetical protein